MRRNCRPTSAQCRRAKSIGCWPISTLRQKTSSPRPPRRLRIEMIGSRLPRLEDHALLTGRGCFVDDVAIADPLHAAFVRSPHPHALIRSVNTDAARTLSGIFAVLTLDDLAPAMAKRRMV